MAPEQCASAGDVDGRADVYSLGVMLYRMIAGRVPFSSDLEVETMTLHVKAAPPLLDEVVPGVPHGVSALVHRMLSKQAIDRPTMAQVADELLALAPLMSAGEVPAVAGVASPGRAEPSTGDATPAPGDTRGASSRSRSSGHSLERPARHRFPWVPV